MRILLLIPAVCLLLACSANIAATRPRAPAEARDSEVEELAGRYSTWRGGAAFERLQSIYLVADIEAMGLQGVTREWRERGGVPRRR